MEHRNRVGTVEKAVDVLQYLHEAGVPRGVTAIGRGLGLPKATAHRLLKTLGRRGLVERDDAGRYRPGIALVALGLGVIEREPVVAAARPVLEAEAERIGETIFLAGARGGRLFVLDKCEGSSFLRAAPRIGSEVPLHATAVGKVYLALAADQVQRDEAAPAYTDRTLLADALDDDLARVAERGWAQNREEWIPGLAGLAAPVYARGRVVASIAASGAAARAEVWGPDAIEPLIRAAREIGARLEGTT
ncbi:MAG: IclR family transcriptional regulator [Deltaproteobacteria bacterium]|nr:IclR family transcriptional regulator [Deltaproteobacteria bacterium]MBW2414178.1 IclR family transcriptional regulator [Deltaproteobacteria bacterium]